jgi:hypothetical protein
VPIERFTCAKTKIHVCMSLGMEIQRNIATHVAFGQTSWNSSHSVTALTAQHECMAIVGKTFQIKSAITSNVIVDLFGHGMHAS